MNSTIGPDGQPRGGQYTVCMRTIRDVVPGEELTQDYHCVTSSDEEFKMAICLCGKTKCRGAFLGYTGNDALQSILHDKHGPLERLASICYSSSCWDSNKDDCEITDTLTKRKKTSRSQITTTVTRTLPDCTSHISSDLIYSSTDTNTRTYNNRYRWYSETISFATS